MLLPLLLAGCAKPQPESEFELTANDYAARGDYASAMLAASAELELTSDAEAAADLLMIISDCHAAAGNGYAALEFAHMAADHAPDYIAAKRALVNAATHAGDHGLALRLLKEIPTPDSAGIITSLRQTVDPALAAGRTDLAENAIRRLLDRSEWLPPRHMVAMARIYRDEGHPDSADIIMSGINPEEISEPKSLEALAGYYESCGATDKVTAIYRRLAATQDSIIRAAEASGIYSRLYDYEHAMRLRQEARAEARNARMRYVIPAIIAALAAAIALALYFHATGRRRLLESQNKLLLAAEEMRKQSEQSRSVIGRLFKDSHDSIELAANLLIDGSTARSPEVVMRQLRTKVEACRRPEFISELESAVNDCHNNVMARLRADIPGITEPEITVALYCAAGLSPRVICLMLNCTPAALYNKKYRLKRKIQTAGIADRSQHEYLQLID